MSYVGIERRRWPRIPALALGNMSVSILAGPDAVKVIDLSCGGALLEVAARFPLKSSVRLRLTQPGAEQIVVEGRVARAKVAALVNGVINYRFAVIFDHPIAAVPGVAAGDQLAGLVAGASPAVAKDVPVAIAQAAHVPERMLAIVPARPVAAPNPNVSDDPPVALRGDLERERTRLEQELAAATAELDRQSAVNQSLAERLEKSDELRTAFRDELESERSRLQQELSAVNADLARQSTLNRSLAANLAQSDELLTGLRDELAAERRLEQELAAERGRRDEELAAERSRLEEELAAERSRLEEELAASTANLAGQSTINRSLAANLAQSDELLTGLRDELAAERRLEQELAAERRRRDEELAAERSRLEEELATATADLAGQSTISLSLAAKLEESEELRTAWYDELQAERGQWEEDRSTLLQQVADAVTVADALQSERQRREQEQAQTLAEQRDKFEALISELVTSNNDQQTEYEQLVEELTAAGEQQRRRAEHYEAEAARERAAAQQGRTDAEARRHELEARREAAETLCAAHDARLQALRQHVEILMSLFTAPSSSEAPQPAETIVADETEAQRPRAIA